MAPGRGEGNVTLEMVLILLALAGYGFASVSAAVRFYRRPSSGEGIILLSAAFAAALVAAVLVMQAVRSHCVPAFGQFGALACYTTSVTVAFLVLALRHSVRGVSAIVLPYVGLLLLAAAVAVNAPPVAVTYSNFWLALHVTTAFAGHGLFTISAALAIAYLVQDHNLKHKRLGVTFERLPSLGALDHLMYRQMGIGFLMLTMSIVFGFRLVDLTGGGTEWFSDPKVAATVATWVVYASLLHLRGNVGRHGRKIAIATLVGLLLVLFTLVGVGMVAESRHAFALPQLLGT